MSALSPITAQSSEISSVSQALEYLIVRTVGANNGRFYTQVLALTPRKGSGRTGYRLGCIILMCAAPPCAGEAGRSESNLGALDPSTHTHRTQKKTLEMYAATYPAPTGAAARLRRQARPQRQWRRQRRQDNARQAGMSVCHLLVLPCLVSCGGAAAPAVAHADAAAQPRQSARGVPQHTFPMLFWRVGSVCA